MARIAPGPAPGSLVEYVPECFDNKLRPNPIVVTLIAPSEKERRQIDADPQNALLATAPEGETDEARYARISAWQEKMLRRFVMKVANYTARGGIEVRTADDLIEHGERLLYVEAYSAVAGLIYMTDESAKFYAEPLDSSPQATRPLGGTAVTADFVASTASAIAALAEEPTRNSSTLPQTV